MNAVMMHQIALLGTIDGCLLMLCLCLYVDLGWAGLGDLSAVSMDVVHPVFLPVTIQLKCEVDLRNTPNTNRRSK